MGDSKGFGLDGCDFPIDGERVCELFGSEDRAWTASIQDWIVRWYSALPSDKQREISGRLRADDGRQFTSAFFELQMFAALRFMGYEVEVEPSLAGGSYNPDFLARGWGDSFYLEATVCGEGEGTLGSTTDEEDAVGKIRSALRELGSGFHSHLSLKAEGSLCRTLSKRVVSQPFVDLMKHTTASEVWESYHLDRCEHERRAEYSAVLRCGDWLLEGVLVPKIREYVAGCVLGPLRGAYVDASKAIADGLRAKAKHWKRAKNPCDVFVVAMSICHGHHLWVSRDEMFALTGSRKIDDHDGPWVYSLSGVSGILFVGNVSRGNVLNAETKLVLNPKRHLSGSLARLAELVRGRKLVELTGFPVGF